MQVKRTAPTVAGQGKEQESTVSIMTSKVKKVTVRVHKSHVAEAIEARLINEICPSAPKRSIFTLAEVV